MSSVLMERPLAEMTYSIVHLKYLFRALVQLNFPFILVDMHVSNHIYRAIKLW